LAVNHNPRNLRCATMRDFVATKYRSASAASSPPLMASSAEASRKGPDCASGGAFAGHSTAFDSQCLILDPGRGGAKLGAWNRNWPIRCPQVARPESNPPTRLASAGSGFAARYARDSVAGGEGRKGHDQARRTCTCGVGAGEPGQVLEHVAGRQTCDPWSPSPRLPAA
jgi:hypothetical protein